MTPKPIPPGPGQESVWDYPRPPRLEDCPKRIRVVFNGETIADTTRAKRVLETSHPPVYYIPPEDIRMEFIEDTPGSSLCEWKGQARYCSVRVGTRVAERAAWYFPYPVETFAPIKGHLAFFCRPMDVCSVEDERAQPQPGDFYGGWITSDVVGPFKGGPGTIGW